MNTSFIDQLDITNIHQIHKDEDRINIHFTSNEQVLTLTVQQVNGFFIPWGVYHTFDEKCRICGYENKFVCSGLSDDEDMNDLFSQLIEHPSLRLEWLYIPYKRKVITHDASHD